VSAERAAGASTAIAVCNKAAQEQAARYSEYQLQTLREQTDVQVKATAAVASASAAALGARQSARRLQQRIDALVSASTHSPPSSSSSTSAPDTVVLFADVLKQSTAVSRQLAEYADQARISWQACESSYQSLNPQANDHAGQGKN
jgi:hypothetical protein